LIVVATVQVAHAIALESTLSFLGVGVPVTEPSLGMLIAKGYQYLLSGKYWISTFPGSRWSSPSWRSTSWATACATSSTRGSPGDPHAPARALREGPRGDLRLLGGGAHRDRPGLLRRPRGRGAGAGRRIGLGQVRDRARHPRADRRAGPDRGRVGPAQGGGARRALRGRPAARARPASGHDLPGPDEHPQPGAAHRHPDDRGDPGPRAGVAEGGAGSGRAGRWSRWGSPPPTSG
jgi:hypothetical protein